jgi:hypothetical protein
MRRGIICCLLAGLLILPLAGCTSYIDVSGHVYEWTNAPSGAQSHIYYDETAPAEFQIKPVSGAKILLQDEDKSHTFTLESQEDGYFHLGTTVELSEAMNIEGSHTGYQTGSSQFDIKEAKNFYEFNIVLAPTK